MYMDMVVMSLSHQKDFEGISFRAPRNFAYEIYNKELYILATDGSWLWKINENLQRLCPYSKISASGISTMAQNWHFLVQTTYRFCRIIKLVILFNSCGQLYQMAWDIQMQKTHFSSYDPIQDQWAGQKVSWYFQESPLKKSKGMETEEGRVQKILSVYRIIPSPNIVSGMSTAKLLFAQKIKSVFHLLMLGHRLK